MLETIRTFLAENWINLALILVGLSALLIYWLQERRKVSEEAALIVMQVEELQKRMREISAFIVEGQLNESAFYESQPLYKTDYWDQYKHHFTRRMDTFSFCTFDEFYGCAAEILEQQQLMKNLQKNSFFCMQQMLMQMETNSIMQNLPLCSQNPIDPQQLVNAIVSTIPQDTPKENEAQPLNCSPFVRQYGILNNEWGVILCPREYRTRDTQRNSRSTWWKRC